MRSSVISVCGQSLPVQCQTAGDAGISAKLIDVVRVLRVEKDMILDCLRCASLAPKFSSPVENEEILDEASLSFVLMQFRPVQWAEICCEIKRVSTSSNQEEDDEDDDEDNDDEDQTPCRTAIKLKSRRLNNVEENDDHQEQQQRREIEVTLPKSFSRQQYTKQYALRDYDIGPTLQRDLISLQEFWTRPFNGSRQAKPVGATTFAKRRERILCFLGFLVLYRCVADRNDLTLALYGEWRAFESYLCYLKEVRMLSAATIAESLTAAVFVAKWLCREVENPGRNFSNVELVRRYRDWRNQQASMALRERRDETWDELREQGRWLHWDEYCRATQLMRDKFEASKATSGLSLKGAKLLHDALLLALFQALPARSGEVRLLEYIPEEEVRANKGNLTFRQYAERERLNLLTKRDGKWTMFLSQYKTFRHQGVDVTEFDAQQHHASLVNLLALWLENYRPIMMVGIEPQHRFVFITRGGKPFGDAYFSEFLARLICKLTGQSVGANLLRSSFISYFYAGDSDDQQDDHNQSPAVRESVAKAMRHSVREAERTYDRRTALEKKRKGMEILARASSFAQRERNEEGRE